MNKKIISILGAAALTLSLVVGGVIMTGIQTVASGTQIVLSVDSPVVERDEEIKVANHRIADLEHIYSDKGGV